MNTKQAVLRAADYIERNPGALNFTVCSIWTTHDKPGTGACPLAWIGHFLGVRYGLAAEVAEEMIGGGDGPFTSEGIFFRRMTELEDETWTWDAAVCARALRKFAQTYLADEYRMAA